MNCWWPAPVELLRAAGQHQFIARHSSLIAHECSIHRRMQVAMEVVCPRREGIEAVVADLGADEQLPARQQFRRLRVTVDGDVVEDTGVLVVEAQVRRLAGGY